MGGGDVGHIKRRILAHEDNIHFAKINYFWLTKTEMIPPGRANRKPLRPRGEPMTVEGQGIDRIMINGMSPALSLHRQQKCAVGFNVDVFDRVHLNGNLKAHGTTSFLILYVYRSSSQFLQQKGGAVTSLVAATAY